MTEQKQTEQVDRVGLQSSLHTEAIVLSSGNLAANDWRFSQFGKTKTAPELIWSSATTDYARFQTDRRTDGVGGNCPHGTLS